MDDYTITKHPCAEPIRQDAQEMATARIKIIVAHRGSFRIAGRERNAFVVGARSSPIEVIYARDVGCTEVCLPPWVASAVLDVSGRDLGDGVHDTVDLPKTPFLRAVERSDPNAFEIAKLAYANWIAGRRSADTLIAQKVWQALEAEPTRRIEDISKSIEVTDRRVRAALRNETGMSAVEWRKLIRLERATHAVTQTDQNLVDIAIAVGYADQSHMNRDWSELAGISPSKLRSECQAF